MDCEMTLVFGASEKIECLKPRRSALETTCPCILVAGDPSDSKAVETVFLSQVERFWSNKESKTIARFHDLLRTSGDALVFGESECKRALDQNIIQELFVDAGLKISSTRSQVIYGVSPGGQQFCRDYHCVGVLFPGRGLV
jgi:hypothetical protein